MRWPLDVGLELLASLILLCLSIARASSALRSAYAKLVLLFQDKRTEGEIVYVCNSNPQNKKTWKNIEKENRIGFLDC